MGRIVVDSAPLYAYNDRMDKIATLVNIWRVTLRKLKILAAHLGQPMTVVLDNLVSAAIKERGIKVD